MRPSQATWKAWAGLVVLSSTVVLVFAGSAQAANIVPNPGFESNCGAPCMWAPAGSPLPTLIRDTSNPHTGAASIQIMTGGGGTGAQSDCIAGALSGSYSREFWYRTTDTNVASLQMDVDFYTSTDCTTGATASGFVTVFPLLGTTWQHAIGTNIMAPPGTASYRVVLLVNCTTCPSVANVDDVLVDGLPPTVVALTSFTATRSGRAVVVRWRTAGGVGIAGFDVYRGGLRLNRSLIPARPGSAPATYTYIDRRPGGTSLPYRLRLVRTDGTSRWYGPARLRAR